MMTSIDQTHMARAFELAVTQSGRTGENPSVGCVIADAAGKRLAEAATADTGRPHAEQLALGALAQGIARGGTAYVTLEPCRERSTGEAACSSLLVTAGVARVVCALADEHPKGAGGFARLLEAGIKVETGLMADQAEALYASFFASVK